MSLGREEILQHALGLSLEDRVFVLTALEQSLGESIPDRIAEDAPEAIKGAEFLRELERRSASLRSGKVVARPAEEVLAELWQRQASESAREGSHPS